MCCEIKLTKEDTANANISNVFVFVNFIPFIYQFIQVSIKPSILGF